MIHRLTRRLLAAAAAAATTAAAALTLALGAGRAQAASASLFASVTASGTLAHGNGVTSVTHISTGQYEVTFSASDIDDGPLWAGESCTVVNDIKPAAQIVGDLVAGAEAALRRSPGPASSGQAGACPALGWSGTTPGRAAEGGQGSRIFQ